jgi:SAM-dependent methyltransferase
VSSAAGSTWQADAQAYDRWFEQPWGRYASDIERDAVLAAAGDLTQAVVADIGCGTGRLTRELEQRAARVVGLDPDLTMLTIAAHRVDAPLVVGDGHHLPFGTASVDVAIAVTVCEFTTDPAVVISELARITRPGGRVVVGALNRHSPWGLANRQFSAPPWSAARFLTPHELTAIGSLHGQVTIRPALYAPAALPLIQRWGATSEWLGRTIAPRSGAFNVMTIVRAETGE